MLSRRNGAARIIAGGTDLMLASHRGQLDPRDLVDITRIPGLDEIVIGADWITVGATVTFDRLRESACLAARVPALVEAASSVGAQPIQQMATWVGNIAQAMPAADGGVAAVALEAEARVVDCTGARWVAVESLYKGAKTSAVDATRQMISHVRFPTPPPLWGCAWRRVGRRPSLTLPILNCAVTVRLGSNPELVLAATIALSPVAALPFRARQAEEFLLNLAPTPENLQRAAAIAQSECHPRSSPLRASAEYRRALIPVMVLEALALAVQRAGENHTLERL